MTIARPALARRVAGALESAPPRVPVILGPCGTGRTRLLHEIAEHLGPDRCQYVDVERAGTTPERFHRALAVSSPFVAPDVPLATTTPRQAFDATLAFLGGARAADGGPATFLIDEVLEFRTFENFPGLRHLMRELLAAVASTSNRFVLTTRYVTRGLKLLRDAPARLEVLHLPAASVHELRDAAARDAVALPDPDGAARAVHALTGGHACYAEAVLSAMNDMARHGGGDPISALAALLEPNGPLARRIGWCYELRLHRARGYGALKGILGILAEEEPLTLTEIAQRLHRTPGSTKDYLSWLEDVDLVRAEQKRYSVADPLLRLWVRLHCRPSPPNEDQVASEVHQFALARLPQHADAEPAPALSLAGAGASDADDRRAWGIIEID